MFKLVIQDDEGKTTVVPLIRDEITIGRKEGNTIRLTERNVSRRHARILRNNGEVHIEDLGSYNGIRVNNARIAERVSLRVSDQVQIGDYKLYLKAEGLEQVSDTQVSATQVDHSDTQSPTQTMPTVPAPAVTAPQPVQAAAAAPAGALPAGAKHLATGDTDPSGRPIIAASAVSALSETAGYGKLVVLSSNFAGKEFELSRPQMIVGRTDENDIVINHRSISRNHAKLVREPDTGSYTISDLQSSNGVRVNGQDYGKVELRRGDVVDLGHVRLRFVEPGEDFVFARDAVITDVPESGGKRGVVFAILAAIVLIGAGIAVYLTMLQGDHPKDDVVAPGPGTNSLLTIDAGEAAVAIVAPATERPEVVIDAAAQAAVPPPVTTTKPPPDDDSNKVQKNKCAEHMAAQEWQQLFDCAKALEKLGGKDKAKEWAEIAMKEQKNELVMKEVRQLLRDRNLRDAQTALNKIGNESVYYVSLHEQFLKNENAALDVAQRRAQQYANVHDCASLRTQIRQLGASSTPRITAAISAIRCTDKQVAEPVAQRNPPPAGSAAVATGSGSAVTAPAPAAAKGPCETMNVDEVMEQASHQYSSGYAKAALAQVAKALACRQNVLMYRYAATYACAGRDLAQAKLYFAKVPPQFQSGIVQRCQQEGLDLRPQ